MIEFDDLNKVRERFKRKNALDFVTDWVREGSDKGEKGSQIWYQFLAHNLSTHGIVYFEVLIDDPGRKSSEIVLEVKTEQR